MFERFLHQTPFLKFIIPFILGIVLKINFPDLNLPLLYILSVTGFLVIILQLTKLSQHYVINRIWGTLIFIAIFTAGAQLVQLKQNTVYDFANQKHTFIATIIENPEEKENTIKAVLKINAFKDSTGWINPQSKLLVYFRKDSSTQTLKFGDQIIAKTFINKLKHSGNPYAFNYKKYLQFKEIYYQSYITADHFKILKRNQGSAIMLFTNNLRQKLLNIYKTNNITGDEFAVLSALSLGFKNELTPELKESFSTSGAMHVLAVSGLHVGIIFIILTKLLFFIERNKYGRIMQSLIIIFVLVFYAFLTGLSNSVIRASIMFSFICIGRMFTRQVNIYNSLSASAFIMLIYNPYSIMDVGFQLSYLAVFSIVFFQPKIYSLYNPKSTIADYIWQLISVAIAAQVGTFPVTIHYFEQFPVYFILSNILIIPIVSIIIYGAIILFCFSFSSTISFYIAKILNFITFILNKNVELIEKLPYSKFDQLIIDKYEIVILLSIILFISFFMISKRIRYIRYTILFFVLLFAYNISNSIINSKKSMLVVYNIPKHSAINIINGSYSQLFTSLDTNKSNKNFTYNILPLWKRLGLKRTFQQSNQNSYDLYSYYFFKDIRILNINKSTYLKYKPKRKLDSDYLILSDNVNVRISDLISYFNFEKIIFDSSNSYYKIKIWTEECHSSGIKYHSISDQGAFIIHL